MRPMLRIAFALMHWMFAVRSDMFGKARESAKASITVESSSEGRSSAQLASCSLSKYGVYARLSIATSLEPPYLILGLKSREELLYAMTEHRGASIGTNVTTKPYEEYLLKTTRRILTNMGMLSSTSTLSDCGWNIVQHSCIGFGNVNEVCSKANKDMFLVAKNGNDCVYGFSMANDEVEKEAASKSSLTSSAPVFFNASVSGVSVPVLDIFLTEYAQITSTHAYARALDLASSCAHVTSTGFSLGGALGQLHRLDYATNASGRFTNECVFGGKVLGCDAVIFGAPPVFKLPQSDGPLPLESAEGLGDSHFFVEDDLVMLLISSDLETLDCPECPNPLKPGFGDQNYTAKWLPWLSSYQLRRDLLISTSPLKTKPYHFVQKVPDELDPFTWVPTEAFQSRNRTYSHGLLSTMSSPECPLVARVSPVLARSGSCGHFCPGCLLWVDWFDRENTQRADFEVAMPSFTQLEFTFEFLAFPGSALQAMLSHAV